MTGQMATSKNISKIARARSGNLRCESFQDDRESCSFATSFVQTSWQHTFSTDMAFIQISAEINQVFGCSLLSHVMSFFFRVARIQSLVGLEDEVLMFSTFAEARTTVPHSDW